VHVSVRGGVNILEPGVGHWSDPFWVCLGLLAKQCVATYVVGENNFVIGFMIYGFMEESTANNLCGPVQKRAVVDPPCLVRPSSD
jgi:hypothetical protein